MSGSFQYPDHPLSGKKDPFQDKDGTNPFGDPDNARELSDDPYASPSGESRQPEHGDFHNTLAPRGTRILWLSIVGTICGALGLTTIGFSLFGEIRWMGGFGLSEAVPVSLLGFGFSLAAWIMGSIDLKAVRLGAMSAIDVSSTRAGRVMGMIIALLCLVTYLGLIILGLVRLLF